MRRFFCRALPDELGTAFEMSAETSHHLLRVVGIAPDEHFHVFDGDRGMKSKIVSVSHGVATCVGLSWVEGHTSSADIWLLIGLLRPGPMSVALRMATELGVNQVMPVLCERSVARGDKQQRWQSILQSSAAQCGRVDLPVLHALSTPKVALAACEAIPNRFVLSPDNGPRLQSLGRMALWVGPEGGLSANEVSMAHEAGWLSASLGGLVLRADTAVAAALTLVGSL